MEIYRKLQDIHIALPTRGLILLFAVLLLTLQTSLVSAENTASTFNHFSTGFPLEGAHKNVECSSCHLHGIFKGISSTCNDNRILHWLKSCLDGNLKFPDLKD